MFHARFITVSGLIAIALSYSLSTTAATMASDILVSPVAISGLVEGSAFTNVTVATFVDINSPGPVGAYTAAINWGDGTTSPGTIIGLGGGSFNVTGSHTYADEGTDSYSANVTYIPIGFVAIGISGHTVVADAALSLVSITSPISFTAGVPFSNLLLETFRDANPFGPVSDFTGLIDWGDGTQTPGTIIAGSPGVFSLEGSHTYAGGGNFPVLIGINDIGGSSLRTQTTARSVPEPATLALLSLGLAGLGFGRCKKA
jgi:hypothetical protein